MANTLQPFYPPVGPIDHSTSLAIRKAFDGIYKLSSQGIDSDEFLARVQQICSDVISTTAAGGDLTGNYPNPRVAEIFTAIDLYDGSATAGIGLVAVYDYVTLSAQTSSIGSANLTVGGAAAPFGLYAVVASMSCTTAGTGGTVTLNLGWNDGAAARSAAAINASLTTVGTGTGYSVVPLHADGINQITYSTTVAGATGSPQYRLDLALVRLG